MIDILLRFAGGLQLPLAYSQRMTSAFNDMEQVRGLHFRAHAFEKIERRKRIARSLNKEDWRSQCAQNFITKFCPIAHGAERITKADERIDVFFQGNVTTDAPAHALADEDGRNTWWLSCRGKRPSMRRDQLR